MTSVLLAGLSRAQTAGQSSAPLSDEQAPPPQNQSVTHVEPPPPEPRTRHYHDGFYLRLSTGLGYEAVNSTAGDSKVNTWGAGYAVDVLMGGTPLPGLVIGGGSLFQTAVAPGQSSSGPVTGYLDFVPNWVGFWLFGPMIDVFPNPNGGFHLGALTGLAAVGLKGSDDKLSGGGGGSVWAGYGAWAAAQWSLGGLIRLSGARTKRTVGGSAAIDATDGTWGMTLEFSATYH